LASRVTCTLTREQATLYAAAVAEAFRDADDGGLAGAEGIDRRGRILALLTALAVSIWRSLPKTMCRPLLSALLGAVWVEVKIDAPETGHQLALYQECAALTGRKIWLVTLAREPLSSTVTNLAWHQLYRSYRH
jgi:hypothetical protein